MTGGTLSGGVVIAVAAVLWLAYLVPTWLRRRDYLNAVRLQQTLRILAETAEIPREIRVEATARDVARQQKILKRAKAKVRAAEHATAVSEARIAAKATDAVTARGSGSDAQAGGKQEVTTREGAAVKSGAAASIHAAGTVPKAAERERAFAHAVRRTRLFTSIVVLVSVVGAAFGVYLTVADGAWVLLAASLALLVCAFLVLRRLAVQVAAHRAARRARGATVATRTNPELFDHAPQAGGAGLDAADSDAADADSEAAEVAASWRPKPLPKPLYQSPGSRAAAAMASHDAAARLRHAAARASMEERAARATAPAAPVRERPAAAHPAVSAQAPQLPAAEAQTRPAASAAPAPVRRQAAAPSKYAAMGKIDDGETRGFDVDEALRRRRIAG